MSGPRPVCRPTGTTDLLSRSSIFAGLVVGAIVYLTLGHASVGTIERCSWDTPEFLEILHRGFEWARTGAHAERQRRMGAELAQREPTSADRDIVSTGLRTARPDAGG